MKIVARPSAKDKPGRCTTWRLFWEVPPGPDGGRRQVTETFHGSRRDAEVRWRQRQAEIDRGAAAVPRSRLTLAEFLDGWLRTRTDLKPSTAHSYREIAENHLIPYIGKVALGDLTPEHLRKLYADLLRGGRKSVRGKGQALSPRRVRYAHSVLRAALAAAVREEIIARNVADLVKPPKPSPAQIQPFTLQQCMTLMQTLGGHRLKTAFLLSWSLGLRRGELLGLHWSDVDLDRGVLYVRSNLVEVSGRLHLDQDPKTAKGHRGLVLPERLVAELRSHRDRQRQEAAAAGPAYQDSDLVFATPLGRPIRPSNFYRLYRQMRDKAGLPPYSLHALRHTNATLLLQAGVPLPVVSEQLGHADYSFTKNVYGHLRPELQRISAQAIDRLLAQNPPDAL